MQGKKGKEGGRPLELFLFANFWVSKKRKKWLSFFIQLLRRRRKLEKWRKGTLAEFNDKGGEGADEKISGAYLKEVGKAFREKTSKEARKKRRKDLCCGHRTPIHGLRLRLQL